MGRLDWIGAGVSGAATASRGLWSQNRLAQLQFWSRLQKTAAAPVGVAARCLPQLPGGDYWGRPSAITGMATRLRARADAAAVWHHRHGSKPRRHLRARARTNPRKTAAGQEWGLVPALACPGRGLAIRPARAQWGRCSCWGWGGSAVPFGCRRPQSPLTRVKPLRRAPCSARPRPCPLHRASPIPEASAQATPRAGRRNHARPPLPPTPMARTVPPRR